MKRNAFCRASFAKCGPNGTVQAGWLTGTVAAAEAPKATPATTPSYDASKMKERARTAANTALADTVDDLCLALNTSRKAAQVCPSVKGVTGVENLLQLHLGRQAGSVAERCAAVGTGALRAEMRQAGDLVRKRRAKDAIAVLDTRALAALYGVQDHCDDRRRKYPGELWLVTRKRYQLRL